MGGFRSFVQLLLRGLSSSLVSSGPAVTPPITDDLIDFKYTISDSVEFNRTINDVIDF